MRKIITSLVLFLVATLIMSPATNIFVEENTNVQNDYIVHVYENDQYILFY